MTITIDQLRKICPLGSKNMDVFIPYLNQFMNEYGINTPRRAAMFIAQAAHETGGFKYLRELASGSAYDTGRKAIQLGNTPEADGDGQKYKGRGIFQITGKTNYKACGKSIGADILSTPELLETPQFAVKSACWFWVEKKGNSLADLPDTWRSQTLNYSPFQYITYRINGGQNGYADRLEYYSRSAKVFNDK